MGLFALALSSSAEATHSKNDDEDAAVSLPKMDVRVERLQPSWLIPRNEVRLLELQWVLLDIYFSGRARTQGIVESNATVAVMIDAAGNSMDFLVVEFSGRYFADALRGAPKTANSLPG